MSKEIKKITADEVYPVSMRRLGDRPNSSSAQGRGGMSSAELKGFMDKYPELVKERLNELIDMCNADSENGIAKAIKTPVIDPETGNEFSLYDWFAYAKIYLKGDKGDTGVGIQSIEKRTGVVDFDDIMNGIDADHYRITLTNGEIFDFKIKNGKKGEKGDKGDKGDSIEQIIREASNTAQSVSYDSTSGATIEYTDKTVLYKDSTTGETKSKVFPAQLSLPILPGKYIYMGATSDNKKMEVRVDDTELALDYIKLDKTKTSAIPQNNSGILSWLPTSISPTAYSLVQRDGNGNSQFNAIYINLLVGKDAPYQQANMNEVYRACRIAGTDQVIAKTPTDTGTFSADLFAVFQGTPNSHIIYDNQLYYRMDPTDAPDGTLNFIHIDSVQNGGGTYKATGKCFSITVSTRAWQVVDLDFGGSSRTTHNLTLNNSATGTSIYFSLTNNRTETYEGAPAGLWSALENSPIACTVDNNGTYGAGIITIDGDNFKVMYGNSEELMMTQPQVSITDSLV